MNKFKLKFLLAVFILSCVASAGADEKLYFIAPTQIPNVLREMKTAGFWIDRVADPDAVLLDETKIEAFNRRVRDEWHLTKDVLKLTDPFDGKALKEEFISRLVQIKEKGYFGDNGEKASEKLFERIRRLMAVEKIRDELDLKYGFIVHYADQRFFPTDEGLFATALDIDFDELQNSALDAATPVVILHTSADKKWLYVAGELTDGWVKAGKVALGSREDVASFLAAPSFIVVTDAKADIYLDEALSRFYDHARMGVKFPSLESHTPVAFAVLLPTRAPNGKLELKTAYMKKDQASQGYLPFSPRLVLEQAFKLLNAPYGWGGLYGEQDCSRFLQEVYASVGVSLPRNSKEQAQAGEKTAAFEEDEMISNKLAALKKATAGHTVLAMKGHIMLYLGTVNGRPYAIHALWGYREPTPEGERVRVINRVAVSDLYLGEGSQKGSLLERTNAIVTLTNP